MRKNKKVLSIIMVLAIILSSNCVAIAQTNEFSEYKETASVIKTDEGNIFYYKDDVETITIVTNEKEHLVEVDIMNADELGVVYQLFISDYAKEFDATSDEFWDSIISIAKENIADAKIIKIDVEDVTYEKPIDVTNLKSSAGADLKSDLEDLLGSEYEGSFKYLKSNYSPYAAVRIYERMYFRIYDDGYKNWSTSDTLTIGAFITGVLSLGSTTPLIGALALVFDVSASASSVISSSGRINKYSCTATISRYATVNGSQYMYNVTDKAYVYKGYEDNDLNSTGRAAVDSSSEQVIYTESSSYFADYSEQCDDAHDLFLIIGQKP